MTTYRPNENRVKSHIEGSSICVRREMNMTMSEEEQIKPLRMSDTKWEPTTFGFCTRCFDIGQTYTSCKKCNDEHRGWWWTGTHHSNGPSINSYEAIQLRVGNRIVGYPHPEDLARALGHRTDGQWAINRSQEDRPNFAYWKDFIIRTTPTFRQWMCLHAISYRVPKLYTDPQDLLYTRNPPNYDSKEARATNVVPRYKFILPDSYRTNRTSQHRYGICNSCLNTGECNTTCGSCLYATRFTPTLLTLGVSKREDYCNIVGVINPLTLDTVMGGDLNLNRPKAKYPFMQGMDYPKISWTEFIMTLPNEPRNKIILWIVNRTTELNRRYTNYKILAMNVPYALNQGIQSGH